MFRVMNERSEQCVGIQLILKYVSRRERQRGKMMQSWPQSSQVLFSAPCCIAYEEKSRFLALLADTLKQQFHKCNKISIYMLCAYYSLVSFISIKLPFLQTTTLNFKHVLHVCILLWQNVLKPHIGPKKSGKASSVREIQGKMPHEVTWISYHTQSLDLLSHLS